MKELGWVEVKSQIVRCYKEGVRDGAQPGDMFTYWGISGLGKELGQYLGRV